MSQRIVVGVDSCLTVPEVGPIWVVLPIEPVSPETTNAKFTVLDVNNFALEWDEPVDAAFDHAHLRRDTGATIEYLNNVGGLAVWETSVATFWKFKEGPGGPGISPESSHVDENVSGSPTYYVRGSGPLQDGTSCWKEITIQAQVTSPLLTASNNGDGTATLTVSGADIGTVNDVFVRSVGGSFPNDPIVTFAGPGGVSIETLAPGEYYAKVLSMSLAGTELGINDPVFFIVTNDSELATFYRVVEINRLPGSGTKTVVLQKIDRPIFPLQS